ncbi:MAG: hypothetical protein HOG49_21330 [Candidatus Scalindua sp.]|jgi:hypothetical protein|nr:hypothetical protein [Candidatus Scalindua sp.]
MNKPIWKFAYAKSNPYKDGFFSMPEFEKITRNFFRQKVDMKEVGRIEHDIGVVRGITQVSYYSFRCDEFTHYGFIIEETFYIFKEEEKEPENIVSFTGKTRHDIPADKILERAIGKLDRVVIMGYDRDGEEYLAASMGDRTEVNWIIDRLKYLLISGKVNE